MKLKEIIDKFGWDKIQQDQLPPEIRSEAANFERRTHKWDLYALNGVLVATQDDSVISSLTGIAKTPDGYTRRVQIPKNTVIEVDDMQDFLEGFKKIHSFENIFLYDSTIGTSFRELGKMVEDAGELYKNNYLFFFLRFLRFSGNF